MQTPKYTRLSILLLALFSGATALGQTQTLIEVAQHETLGEYLVDAQGRSLYLFLDDEVDEEGDDAETMSTCFDECAENWPPFIPEDEPVAGEGVNSELIGSFERTGDPIIQITYNGWPLYYFARDENPGDVNGQGAGEVWYLVSPDGEPLGLEEEEQEAEGEQTEDVTTGAGLTEWEPVTQERLLNPADGEWLHFRRTYDSMGYSPLDQINRENVQDLELVWAWSSGDDLRWEPWITVANGVMFVTEGRSVVNALDAVTGEILWRYERARQEDIDLSQAVERSRAVAFYEDKVLYATADAHLVALDAKTGKEIWETPTSDYTLGYGHTSPPLIIDGKAILGSTGGERGARGFIAAYDVENGEQLWRTWTVPEPGEPGSETWETYPMCGAAWWVGSYDPELDIYYMATGQPCPWSELQGGTGGRLYANNVLALNPDTGEMLWNFESNPHDNFDWDGPYEIVLTDLDIDGETRQALIHMSKTGWGTVLDRKSGEFISAFQAGFNNVLTGWTDDGTPIYDESKLPYPPEEYLDTGKVISNVCPTFAGVRDAQATAYSPHSGLYYVPAENACMDIAWTTTDITPGEWGQPIGAEFDTTYIREGTDYAGMFVAANPVTSEVEWQFQVESGATFSASALPTAGGIVFAGSSDRWLTALNDETGEVLWQSRLNADITGAPMSYEIDGRQYLAVPAGNCGMQFCRDMASLLPDVLIPEGTGVVWVFALPEDASEQATKQ